MNTDEYKIAKKDAKSKAYILLFALIAGSIAFISYLSLSLFTYEEFDHVSKSSKLTILGKIKFSEKEYSQIFYSLEEDSKTVLNLTMSCVLNPLIIGSKYNVTTVNYKYKDLFREGSHLRITGLKAQICKPL